MMKALRVGRENRGLGQETQKKGKSGKRSGREKEESMASRLLSWVTE